jgi:hypothetical protein
MLLIPPVGEKPIGNALESNPSGSLFAHSDRLGQGFLALFDHRPAFSILYH